MWYVETSVLACAVSRQHPTRDDCARLLDAIALGRLDATISSEVMEELLFVFYSREMLDAALQLSGHLQALFPDMLPVTHNELNAACGILDSHGNLSSREAIHAACVAEYAMSGLVTLDESFTALDSILVVSPGVCLERYACPF